MQNILHFDSGDQKTFLISLATVGLVHGPAWTCAHPLHKPRQFCRRD
jgi:hypothetical protein